MYVKKVSWERGEEVFVFVLRRKNPKEKNSKIIALKEKRIPGDAVLMALWWTAFLKEGRNPKVLDEILVADFLSDFTEFRI